MDALLDEVESLEAILMDDVRVIKNLNSGFPETIETTIFPVVDEESEQQYICVTLQVLPTPEYPETSPNFKLLRPRGLDDARLEAIRTACDAKLKESLGFPVVFDLIEVVRELLTDTGNLPSGQCVICLYGFTEGDEFTRTECFHYLHSYCLARHLNALRRTYHEEYDKLPAWLQKTADPFQAACPVCREPIKDETDSLRCAMPPAELQNAPEFKLTKELRELQQRMSALFLQQKSRGAIIDVEAESGAVISIETEEDIRRRLQRKEQTANALVNNNVASTLNVNGGSSGNGGNNGATSSNHNSTLNEPSKASSSNVVVQQAAKPSSPENSHHEHHNRRHYRGGRRHQHHHYHHNRERERERFEQNHVSHTSQAAANASPAAATASGSNAPTGGKHSKSHSHAR